MIKRTVFESEHEMFRDSFRKFLQEEAVPYHEQWEKDGQVSRELWKKAGENGFLSPTVPEAYGGVEGDFRFNAGSSLTLRARSVEYSTLRDIDPNHGTETITTWRLCHRQPTTAGAHGRRERQPVS